MRVTEILKESSILTEQMGLFIRGLEVLLQRGSIEGIEKLLVQFSRLVASKPTATKELAEAWVKLAELSGISVDDAIAMGVNNARKAGVSEATIGAAQKEAQALAKSRGPSLFAKAGDAVKYQKAYWGSKFDSISRLATGLGIAAPILEAGAHIQYNYELYNNGSINQQTLQYRVQWEIDKATKRVVTVIAGGALVKGLFGQYGIRSLPFTNGPRLSAAFDALGAGAKTTFIAWLTTDQGTEALANWLVGNSLMPGGRAWAWLVEILSGAIKSGYDAMLRAVDSDKAQQLPPDKELDLFAKDPNAPPQAKYNLGTGRRLN